MLALVCAVTTVTVPRARAADTVTSSTAPPVRTFTYNLCGSGGTQGCLVSAAENKARHDAVVAETSGAWSADYIFLVEICRYQYDAVNTSLRPRGYTGRYVETVPAGSLGPACKDPAGGTTPSYGMAVFVRGQFVAGTDLTLDTRAAILDTVGPVTLGPVTAEDIKAPCVKAWVQYRQTWACSVHLWWGTPTAPVRPDPATPEDLAVYEDRVARHAVMVREADLLARKAKEWEDSGVPVVLGGDFNSSPRGDVLDRFYEPGAGGGAYGTFVEADETDRDHFGRIGTCADPSVVRCRTGDLTKFDAAHTTRVQKLDYTFFGSRYFRGVVGDVPAEPRTPGGQWISDHLPVRAAAFWQDCGPYGTAPGAVYRRDAVGGLYRYEGRADGGSAALARPCKVGTGWTGMKAVARQGTTLAAVDAAGGLWHYPVSAEDGSYAGGARRHAAGTGFQGDDLLLAPGDFDGDGTADLITRDTTGGFWLHRGTGEHSYAPRTRIAGVGGDPATYRSAVATDFTRGTGAAQGAADLVTVDRLGVLWLQEGNGDGTLAERRAIGNGWQIYEVLAAPGDLNGDGKADLTGRDAGGDLWFYKGDGAGGYAPRVKVGSSFPAGELLF
ncbi:endonuclease/exonuclease/phosphatase family protein [Streptomyces sp. NPDC015130]|uniref:endonuclease/exonuclease/phosphatase family protein n=1 Tax=Streptomyces sp. NPDC015130 TaxID=3364940 RepID=UPI0036FD8C6F